MMNLNKITGQCPYCHSPFVISGAYSYKVDGTRTPSLHCKDCNRNFSFDTYLKEETQVKSVDMALTDMQAFGLIEETEPEHYRITELGHNVIKQRKMNDPTAIEDNIILEFPIWKELLKILPAHPTYEMFVNALMTFFKDEPPIRSECMRLWHKYSTEVEPARDRKAKRKGMAGFAGITLLPYEKGMIN